MKPHLAHFALLFSLCWSFTNLRAQNIDSIKSRTIFIGDAGEINSQQEDILSNAARYIIPNKTNVVFLGDNIYPNGMALTGDQTIKHDQNILRTQFEPMRAKGAPVYFIPGNHDWDHSGKKGLEKIRAQSAFIKTFQDSLLKMVPDNGCPDPIEIQVSENVVMIVYDSEWWLFPYKKLSAGITCDCESTQEVEERMEELLYKNRDKMILLAAHHPFRSYGVHGGYYSWKDHIFPLTNLNKNLFVPLPLIGSLYPVLRSTVFLNPEDLHHPAYQQMIAKISQAFEEFPNILFIGGHEHGLQLINYQHTLQIISGAGAKTTPIKKSKNSLFKAAKPGFVAVDELLNKNIRITFYTYENNHLQEAFSYVKPYNSSATLIDSLPAALSQEDSIYTQANPTYDKVGNFHRKLFGENYRKEWAAETEVPIIRISSFEGGLTPLKRGGGMQTVSLRLEDKKGKQWVIRSVNKNTDALLPAELQQTFARDFLDDANSAQHPYSALMVPPLADAVGIPHTNPIIGIIAPDTALGVFNKIFANTLCLVEEREPLGDSDNTPKMLSKLNHDNDDTYKAKTFLRARMLDLLIGDWDRHEDQWRWKDEGKEGDKDYLPIPRDRDQAFRVTDGFFPGIASKSWVLPTLQGFSSTIKHVDYSLFKSDFLNAHPKAQFSHKEWMKMVDEFVKDITDSVLEESLRRLPSSSYKIRHDALFEKLKQRRDAIPEAMDTYYRFINNIIDIKLSDKHERVEVTDESRDALKVSVRKINKEGEVTKKLMEKVYDPDLTEEIRIYLGGGDDSVHINNSQSKIKLRIIGGQGSKDYHIDTAANNIKLYDVASRTSFSGHTEKLRRHLSNDSANTAFVPVNLYNVWMPLVTLGYNADDGLMVGGGFRYTHQRGFRKTPFTNRQQLLVSGAFATGAVKVRYHGLWKELIGKADLRLDVHINAPNNTQNFFGLGNTSVYDKDQHNVRYYRARFNLYEVQSALQWTPSENATLSIGPAFQLYYYDSDDNEGRFINNTSQLHTYDSLTIAKDKTFAGIYARFIKDSRNSALLTTDGGYFRFDVNGYKGLNSFSKSFLQAKVEMAVYKSFFQKAIVIANRIGGGATFGKTTFYQALFLGGQENLWGYRQYRFAGEQLFFNNFEARIKLAQIGSYIVPGQLGIIGFYDIGKVWAEGLNSERIHQGTGGGFYYAPARIALLQFVFGHSREGWYPYFTMGFRF
ncbi:metallophosphoesterase [Olivibacter domesticus]|uniref:Calcineurin-like phosphoesterase n=1 Tax=Olivibacter domesticus TaxID=407022 RepID=A0A1H7Z8M2_OLID1|nr:metallophosphoesterase [Olivibacter domesticus]SEM53827.1 Calcineurin-like phosphoesterase [Olivibacter domesticus]